ncbi:MAG TPA: twin-arginine translocase subunit TatC [Acidimicrobiaceae bacterium]|nr:twin-arginine translocase subunit TatC [Acidimicrobiaceae bacterium]
MKLPFRRGERQPNAKTPDDRMTLTEHLAELRTRIIRSLLAIVLGVIIILAFYDQVLDFMRRPYEELCKTNPNLNCELQFIGPLEGFTTRLSISTYGGIIIAMPVLLWQLWRFIVPALHAKEKKYAIPFIVSSIVLFAFGATVAYFTLTPALDFLISWAGEDVQANFQVSKYVSLFGLMVAAFGVAFLFPVLLVFLQLVGVLTPQTLLRQWRYALVIIFVIAAVITPSGDPYSMMALALPMSIFYLISVVIGRIAQKRKQAREAAA